MTTSRKRTAAGAAPARGRGSGAPDLALPAGYVLERSLPVWTTDHRELGRARRLDRVEHHVRAPGGESRVVYTDRTGTPLSAWHAPAAAADAVRAAGAGDGELRVLDLPWLMQSVLWRRGEDDDELTVLHAVDPEIVGKRFSREEFDAHLRGAKAVRGIEL